MHSNAAARRRYDAEFKAKVVAETDEPGASIAAIARAHGLNANLVHKWRYKRADANAAATADSPFTEGFVPLQLAPPMVAGGSEIRIELRHGATTASITWPVQAADACTAWLREWLR